jgi:hypothetical protein
MVMASTTNLFTIRPPRLPESRSQSGHGLETLSGSLSVVSAMDVLEWLCSSLKVWSLRLNCQEQGQAIAGEVVVVEGQMVDARWGETFGLPALCEIVGCQEGSFELAPVSGSVERTLDGNWRSLLLTAVQMLDERNHQRRSGAPSEKPRDNQRTALSGRAGELVLIAAPTNGQAQAVVQDAPSVSHGVFDANKVASANALSLIDLGFAALRAGNRAEARQCWTQAVALEPDNRSLQFNLRKLDSAGHTEGAVLG